RLHQQRFIRLQVAKGGQNSIKGGPIACSPPAPAVDNEVVRIEGYLWVEVVLEHAVGGFDLPVLARQLRAARRLDGPGHERLPSEGGTCQAGVMAARLTWRARLHRCSATVV